MFFGVFFFYFEDTGDGTVVPSWHSDVVTTSYLTSPQRFGKIWSGSCGDISLQSWCNVFKILPQRCYNANITLTIKLLGVSTTSSSDLFPL